jgi:chromosomal replication initiator protein
MKLIESIIAHEYKIAPSELHSATRGLHSYPRQVVMYMARRVTNLTQEEIGAYFDRDHGTVIHACKAVQDAVDAYPKLAEALSKISRKINLRLESAS